MAKRATIVYLHTGEVVGYRCKQCDCLVSCDIKRDDLPQISERLCTSCYKDPMSPRKVEEVIDIELIRASKCR